MPMLTRQGHISPNSITQGEGEGAEICPVAKGEAPASFPKLSENAKARREFRGNDRTRTHARAAKSAFEY